MNTDNKPPRSKTRPHSKVDVTGRSTGKLVGRLSEIMGPPKGEPWIWLAREILESDAWCAMAPNTSRLVHFLLVEHANHAGTENGNLAAPYDQLVAYGCTRSRINDAIAEAYFLGLIDVVRGGRWADTNQPSRYRLTFYPTRDRYPATNRWKGVTTEDVIKWRAGRRKRRRQKLKRGSQSDTTVMHNCALR